MSAEQDRQRLMAWFKGHEDAVRLVEQWLFVCHVWDDIVDGDRRVHEQDVNLAFWTLAFEVPANPFYSRHALKLRAVMATHALDWFAANTLEASGDAHQAHIAYTLRCNVVSLIGLIATIIGGPAWGAVVQAEARRYGQRERLGSYLHELSQRHGRLEHA